MPRQFKTTRSLCVFRFVLLCVLQLFLSGCGTQGAIESADAPPTLNGSEEQTEVVVISTQHFLTDMPEGYTPGHLRALLEKISPDALAVEAPSNVEDPWSHAPFELWNVTQPWAIQSGVEIVPSGWHEPQYQMQIGQMIQRYQAKGKTAQYQQLEQEFQTSYSAQPMTCKFMNSAAYHQQWRDYHAGLHELLGADTPWEKWNAKMLTNVREACRKHAGQRVAVIFGGAHSYYFLDQLSNDPTVKLVSAEQFFPLTENEIAVQTQQVDYLKALRPLNFSVASDDKLAQARPILEKVKEMPDFAADYLLFHGKYLLHEGKANEAFQEFQKLAKYPRDTLSKSDGKSRLAEVAMVYSGLALNKMGDSANARQQFDDIVKDTAITPSTRQWAQQILSGMAAE